MRVVADPVAGAISRFRQQETTNGAPLHGLTVKAPRLKKDSHGRSKYQKESTGRLFEIRRSPSQNVNAGVGVKRRLVRVTFHRVRGGKFTCAIDVPRALRRYAPLRAFCYLNKVGFRASLVSGK